MVGVRRSTFKSRSTVLDIPSLKNLLKIFSKLSMERTDLEMCQRNKENIKIDKSLSLIFDVHNW